MPAVSCDIQSVVLLAIIFTALGALTATTIIAAALSQWWHR